MERQKEILEWCHTTADCIRTHSPRGKEGEKRAASERLRQERALRGGGRRKGARERRRNENRVDHSRGAVKEKPKGSSPEAVTLLTCGYVCQPRHGHTHQPGETRIHQTGCASTTERERESGAAEDALQDFDCAVSVSVCLSVWSLVVFCLSVGPPRMNDVADAFCAGWC